jgi:hypothetical protein
MNRKQDAINLWDTVRETPLTTVVESLYPGAKKERDSVGSTARGYAKEAWKYTLSSGDHLKVAGPGFYFFEREVSGGGAINLYGELCGTTPEESVAELVRDFHPMLQTEEGRRNASKPERRRNAPAKPKNDIPEVPKEAKPYKLPPVSRSHLKKAKEYLVKGRGLNEEFVDAILESRNAYPAVIWKEKKDRKTKQAVTKNGKKQYYRFLNLVQPVTSFRTGEVIGVSNRSLDGSSKINEGDKQCGAFQIHPYGDHTERVVLTESPIEAMSYYQIHKPGPETSILGQSGTSIPLWFIYEAGKKGCVIQSSLNNDIAARKSSGKTQQFCKVHGIAFENQVPNKGEVSIEMEPTEEHVKLAEKLAEIAEEKQLSMRCQVTEEKKIDLRIENTVEVCREIYKTEKEVSDQTRDLNREKKWEFRQDHPNDPFPTEPGFEIIRPQMDIDYCCTDWNDVVRGFPGKEFTEERVFDVPADLTQALNPEPEMAGEGSAAPDQTEVQKAVNAPHSPQPESVEVGMD